MNNEMPSNLVEGEQQPYRTVLASLGGLFALLIVGFGLSYGLIGLMDSSGQCEELALIMCGMVAIPIAITAAVVTEVAVARRMLIKKAIPHPLAIPLLAVFTALVFAYILAGVQNIVILCLASSVIFITSFMLYDWFLNRVKGKFDSKILRIITGLVTIIIVGFLLNFYILR